MYTFKLLQITEKLDKSDKTKVGLIEKSLIENIDLTHRNLFYFSINLWAKRNTWSGKRDFASISLSDMNYAEAAIISPANRNLKKIQILFS